MLVADFVREAAGAILESDEDFRARALDMAHLSDSDTIKIEIKLEAKGQ